MNAAPLPPLPSLPLPTQPTSSLRPLSPRPLPFSKEPIGCEGLTFLPYLAGERTPNWPHASGCLVGIRAGHLARPGLVYRAALEGVSFSIRNSLASMKLHGVPPDAAEARVVGGGFQIFQCNDPYEFQNSVLQYF